MLTGTIYAGGTPDFDPERTGQPTGVLKVALQSKLLLLDLTELERAPVKGEPTKQAPITPEDPEPAEMTFTFVEGRERGGAQQNYLYGQEGEVQQLTVSELRDYFESDK